MTRMDPHGYLTPDTPHQNDTPPLFLWRLYLGDFMFEEAWNADWYSAHPVKLNGSATNRIRRNLGVAAIIGTANSAKPEWRRDVAMGITFDPVGRLMKLPVLAIPVAYIAAHVCWMQCGGDGQRL